MLGILVISMLIFTNATIYGATIQIEVDGLAIVSDVEPQIKNNRVMVPLRFIAETFGCVVDYKDHTVVITTEPLSKKFVSFEGQMAIITEDVTLQDPYVITEDSKNKLVHQKINNDVFSLKRNLFKDNGNQAIVGGAMSYDGINDTHQFWDTLVEVPGNNVMNENEIYWPYIGDDIMEKVDKLIKKDGPEVLFKGLESTNVYSQYYCINRLVEYYNEDDIRARAIDEIRPFLNSKNKTLKDGAQFAISVLDKKFDSPYIVSGIDGIKVFHLFNNYSDYGSYNKLWMMKDDKLSRLHSFNGIQAYIDMEEPIKLSPQKDKIAVRTSSRKSSSLNIIDLNTGKVSPEIMRLAIEKVATDHKDYNNTYPDGGYSWGHALKWINNDTVEFQASLSFNYMEIIEEVTVRYNVSNQSLEYAKQ